MPVATETWNLSSVSLSLIDGTTANVTGEVLVEPTGKVELRVHLHRPMRLEDFVEGQDIAGQTVDGLDLLAQGAFASQANYEFTFIEDRNAMFHSGAPGAYQAGASSTWSAIKPELIQLYRQIDDILLTILGYQGPIHRWDAPDTEVQFP